MIPASPTPQLLAELVDASLGKRPLDLLVTGAQVLDVYRGAWSEANIGVSQGRIVSVDDRTAPTRATLDATNRWVVPGLFDPHFHAGGSHLTPARLAEALLARGTTSTICDFQEHYTVAGVPAARAALDEAAAAGLRVYYMAPLQQFVVRDLGVTAHAMRVEDMLEMLDWPETVGINEPPPAQVLSEDPELLRVIAEALRRRLVYSGHAPEIDGRELQAYLATGPSSDHESGDEAAAWMKLGLGMKLIMRQGSAAPDLPELIELARTHPLATRHMSFGTDEVDPVDLDDFGHQDGKVRYAISRGVDPIVALQMATLNPAEYYRIDHEIGAIVPGRCADLVVLDDVESVSIETVVAGGRVVEPAPDGDLAIPATARSAVRFRRELTADSFHVASVHDSTRVRVIELTDGSLVSGAGRATLPTAAGGVTSDPARDLLKIALIDRHTDSGDVGMGFVSGFGFTEGAVATTYQHPFFNVLVVGTSDDALALAANRMAELGGGVTVVHGGEVVHDWALETVGVFAKGPLDRVRRDFSATNDAIRGLGCQLGAPILALAFAALPTIPAYGLSTKGLYDVDRQCFVDVVIDPETG